MTNQNANDSQIEVGNQPPAPPGANDQAQLHCGNKVYKSGPLFLSSKVGIGWTSWKKRWFTLTETSLVFYRSDPTVTPQKGGEVNLTLGGIDLNSSGSVVVKEDKKLLTVLFPDDRDGRFVTLKAETLEDLLDWKAALEEALASAPSVDSLPGQNEVSRNDQASAVDLSTELSKDREPAKSLVLGQPVLLALEDIDGTPSFLEKALRFMEEHGVRVEGILRQAADVENVERRIREYEQGKSEFSPDEDAHVIADCVKYILRELPSSPVPTSCCNALLEAFRTERATRVNCMRSAIFETFPEPNRHLLQRILMMMQTVVFHKIENRMSTPAVAACMAPLLLRPLLAGECEIESDFEMGTDGSVQLIQAAAAANHAQAIVITLLEEYDKLFASSSVQVAVETICRKALYCLSYTLIQTVVEARAKNFLMMMKAMRMIHRRALILMMNLIASPVQQPVRSVNVKIVTSFLKQTAKPAGACLEVNLILLFSMILWKRARVFQFKAMTIRGRRELNVVNNWELNWQKHLLLKSQQVYKVDLPKAVGALLSGGALLTEIQRLEVSKTDLQLKIAEQAKGNALLQKSLENRKNALHERRLALEKDVAQLQEQLQKERVLRKLLEAGVNMSMVTSPVSSSINGMEEIMETVQAEGGNLGVQHNKHGEESSTLRPDVGDQPQQSLNLQGKDCDKQKDVESIATSQNLEKSTRDKLETCSNKADGDKDMNESQLSGNKHLSQSKQSDSSSSPNSSVGLVNSSSVEEVGMGRGPSTSIRNLGSTNEEHQTHVPKEIQNLDKGNYGQPVHNIEREKESESHHSLDKLQASQSQTSDMGGSNSQQALHKPDQGTKS
ncbi:rho GTPase-activating protein REN1-like isoform X5 [Lycium barbarum]|uniref:rho GTPase-activating protein REN1-like isoform X5 n=1 Tax=Lycium barbarum TaxID=112863 RepID=UPI00293E7CEB|nr:rho GTPase-activating protein REN1-like isoform X5 [Lycium barbarum]